MRKDQPLRKRDAALKERRIHILSAAIDCIVEKGFHNTGMRDIAKRADVSIGNLYNHFPGKHDMLVGIAELEADELSGFVDVLSDDGPVQETLRAFVQKYSAYTSHREAVILNLEITAEAMRERDIADLFLNARSPLTTALVALLRRGVDDGAFRTTAATAQTACFILDLVESGASRTLIEGADVQHHADKLEEFILGTLKS